MEVVLVVSGELFRWSLARWGRAPYGQLGHLDIHVVCIWVFAISVNSPSILMKRNVSKINEIVICNAQSDIRIDMMLGG